MDADSAATFNDQKEKLNTFLEIANTEKQLLTSIYSKGLLHKDVQELYHKARASYENIIVNNYEVVGLQEVEFSLWKLHYKHIDEFRKRIRLANAEKRKIETQEGDSSAAQEIDNYMVGLKSFLSEATEFYQELTKNSEKNGRISLPLVPMKLPQCQYACHRFLICLGDLARYGELCKKQDACKWSSAATYYFEALRIWPDSGNPHNQLALLATYTGDPFLALYHCVRSLAVKEPFPDAWNNLMLLFEESRSSILRSYSTGAHFDLLKPSVWCSMDVINRASSCSSNKNMPEASETITSRKDDIWLLFVRLMSFFLVHSSLEDFQSILASTVGQLEGLVLMDDDEVKATLESYQLMDPSRKGPYRALQLVSVFIFIFHSLAESGDGADPKKDYKQQSALTELAVASTFICAGRLVEKAARRNNTQTCPILPAISVFVEWLVNTIDRAEVHARDEKVHSAMSYFFGALADLLNRLDPCETELAPESTALWEDHELKGFDPVAHAHKSLDFTSHLECIDNFSSKSVCRSRRIFSAATKLANRPSHLRKWISCDKTGKRFHIMESEAADKEKSGLAESGSILQLKDPYQNNCGITKEIGESRDHPCLTQSVTTDEEEVILFKPIIRHNSEPIYTSGTSCDQFSINVISGTATSDESLRRATSLISEQSNPQNDIFSFRPESTNLRYNKPLKQSAAFPAGPPSLNAWVLEKESPRNERGLRDLNRQQLSPIDELASESLSGLSLKETRDPNVYSMPVSVAIHDTPLPYVTPVPSAPLLPEGASWYKGNSSVLPNKSAFVTKEGDGILGASPVSGYSSPSTVRGPLDFVAGAPGFVEGYPPLLGMSSSEWLYHYRNSQNFERVSNPVWPVHSNAPATYENLSATKLTRFDVLDQWGNHLASSPMVYLESPQLHPSPTRAYGAEEQVTDKHFLGYQRAFPYVCGTGMDLRQEQPTLVNYLKERERQIPPESQCKGPNFMRN
ncbi:unnamed protein product [Withania somnifera]